MECDDIGGAVDGHKVMVDFRDPPIRDKRNADFFWKRRRLYEICNPCNCFFSECTELSQIDSLLALPIGELEQWNQAAEAGGRLRSRRPSCSARSSSLGYRIRV